MNRYRLFAIWTTVALAVSAQQTATRPASTNKEDQHELGGQDSVPKVETQLKILTGKLDLTSSQQDKVRQILQNLHHATEKIVLDKSLSREERLAKIRPQRYKAREEILEFLNDNQKKKLDQYLEGPHAEMHGNLSGATQPQR